MSKRKINRNLTPETIDSRYARQQATINKVCSELGLVVWRPDYHADKTDNNTVIIYTKEGHAYNELRDIAHVDEEKGRVYTLENTDINNRFDLCYMNKGRFKTDDVGFEEELRLSIKMKLDRLALTKEKYDGLVSAGIKLCLFCNEEDPKTCRSCIVPMLMANAKEKALESGIIENDNRL